ncbi:MAG: hypothetical protein QOE86_3881 [Solirubrobacteraceae bacterium]|nr:hypothetical protein [Solirubrobacteraceae bacterium]
MDLRIAEMDWAATPLGPRDTWSPALETAVGICVNSRFPMLVLWGPEEVMIYNDGYRPMLQRKHPAALGGPGAIAWAEVWDVIGQMTAGVRAGGAATWSEDMQLFLERDGFAQECFFTFSMSPIPEDGVIAGILTTIFETTDRVLSERRLGLVRALASAGSDARTEDALFGAIARALRAAPDDIPFAHLYLFDREDGAARLALSAGGPAGELDGAPEAIRRAARSRSPVELPIPSSALALPVRARGATDVLGVLIAGLNRHRPFDRDYRDFLDLVTSTIASGIADARAFEDERARADALEALSEAKTAFFNNVSHEFRTPLTLLLGPIEDALGDAAEPLTAAHRERLETARRNALRMRRLVNSLLDFSRSGEGGREADWQVVDLGSLTAQLASTFDSAMRSAGLTLRVECAELPQPAVVDPEAWERLVLNLVSNALKHTWDGEVTVQQTDEDGEIVLRVTDTGTGIAAEELPQLFERFHRVEGSHGRSHEGTGIGLAIVAEVAAQHEGTAAVDSDVGRGSVFTVRIPYGHHRVDATRLAHPVDAAPVLAGEYVADTIVWEAGDLVEPAPLMPGNGGAAGPDARRPRVLVADDNADMRAYLVRLLAQEFAVEAVADGTAALERALTDPPDLLLTDVMMPGLGGVGLLTRLRAEPSTERLPIILLSARAGQEASVDALAAGADDYLVKPFSALELTARVRANLEMGALRERATAHQTALYEREHALVEELQRALLPDRLPDLPDVEVAGCYLPASPDDAVGGDWFDVVRLPDERVMVVVGDVVGHGLRAASTMSHLRTATRAYASEGHDAAGVIDRVSSLVERTGVGLGSTMLLACLDTLTGEVRYASAGHLPGLVARRGGQARWLEHALAPPLGLASAHAARAVDDRLDDGEALVLFTDGLVERRDSELPDRLEELARAAAGDGSPEALLNRLVAAMDVAEKRGDDVALVAVERVPARATVELELGGRGDDLTAARGRLRGWLAEAGAGPDVSDEVVLAVGEALINAVEHGIGDGEGRIWLRGTAYADRLRIVVRDSGRWRRQGPARARGHGLRIMRALMDEVTLDMHADGTRIELQRRTVPA